MLRRGRWFGIGALLLLSAGLTSVSCLQVIGYKEATLESNDAGAGGADAGPCTSGETRACYTGPAGTNNVGICKAGMKTCKEDGTGFGECLGDVTPQPETCGNKDNESCSGHDCVTWSVRLGKNGDQKATAIAVDAEGNSFVTGTFTGMLPLPSGTLSANGNDVFLVKIDGSGTVLWGKSFGASGVTATAAAVGTDSTGAVFLYGTLDGQVNFGDKPVGPGVYVVKLDANHAHVWSKAFGSKASGRALAIAPGGDVVIGGHFTSSDIDFGQGPLHSTNYPGNGFLARLNGADGSAVWSRAVCAGSSSCEVRAAAFHTDDTLSIAAEFAGTFSFDVGKNLTAQGFQDIALGKLSGDGSVLWSRGIGSSPSAIAAGTGFVASLVVDSTGATTMAGNFKGALDFGAGDVEIPIEDLGGFVARYGADKTYGWATVIHGAKAQGAGVDANGDVLCVGEPLTDFDVGGTQATMGSLFVAKLAGTGATSWLRTYGAGKQHVSSVGVAPDSAPVFVGDFSETVDFGMGAMSPSAGSDLFAVKLSP